MCPDLLTILMFNQPRFILSLIRSLGVHHFYLLFFVFFFFHFKLLLGFHFSFLFFISMFRFLVLSFIFYFCFLLFTFHFCFLLFNFGFCMAPIFCSYLFVNFNYFIILFEVLVLLWFRPQFII